MLVLVIDIQSDVVEGSVIDFPQKDISGVPHVLYSSSLHVPRKPHTDGDYLTQMMLKTIEDFASGISKEMVHITNGESLQAIHYVLSTPWVISKMCRVDIKYPNDTDITLSLVNGLVEKERKDLISSNASDMVFVEQKILDVRLNGYSIEKYHGKKARSLTISCVFTMSSDKIIEKIKDAVSRHLRIKKEDFHSAILLQYLVSRGIASEGEEYVALHVHGEHTDVVVVKNDQRIHFGTFPFGTSSILRKVCHINGGSLETVSSRLKMYTELKLHEDEQKNIEKVLMPILKEWQNECEESMRGIGTDVIIPRQIHLYSGQTLSPLLKSTLEEHDFDVVIHFEPLREVHSFALKDMI